MNQKQEVPLLSFADLLTIIRHSKKKILFVTLLFSFLSLTYALTRPILYEAKATFREKSKSSSPTDSSSILTILSTSLSTNGSEAISIMRSRKLLEALVKKMSLQAEINPRGIYSDTLKNISNNISLEWAWLKNVKTPVLRDQIKELEIQNLVFKEELPETIRIRFVSDNEFEITRPISIPSIKGQLEKPFSFGKTSFQLLSTANSPLKGREFTITFQPIERTIDELLAMLKVSFDVDDSTLLRLQLKGEDRKTAAKILNSIMSLYQNFLYNEHKFVINEQIAYLNKRQAVMNDKLAFMMNEQVNSMSKEIRNSGFTDAYSALAFLGGAKHEYTKDSKKLNLENLLLEKLKEKKYSLFFGTDNDFTSGIGSIFSKIHTLKQQAENLRIAIGDRKTQQKHTELEGIDLQTAYGLYVDYSRNLDLLESKLLKNNFILDQMQNSSFEITSLSTALEDPFTEQFFKDATELLLALRDQNNRSPREIERLKDGVELQKSFLQTHLQQSIKLLELEHNLIKDKINALQNITLNLLEQEIAILQEQVSELIVSRLEIIKQQKISLDEQQKDIQREMSELPSKWMSDKMITYQTELNKKMIEEMTRLVESKIISKNLELFQSTPLDKSKPPLIPLPPKLMIISSLGTVLGAFLICAYTLLQSATNGIFVSKNNLPIVNKHVCGSFTKYYARYPTLPIIDHDLNTLRSVVQFLSPNSKSALLLINHGPDYSADLCRLLHKRNQKILLISLDFMQSEEKESSGLLQFLENQIEQPKIISKKEYDFIPSGGISRYAEDILASPKCTKFLEEMKKRYDCIIAVSPIDLHSASAYELTSHFEKVIVNVEGCRWKEIKNLVNLPSNKVGFITS